MLPRNDERVLTDTQVPAETGRIRHLVRQGIRFGLVGVFSTIMHVVIFILCIELLRMQPFWANFPAFSFAFTVGFIGHFSWTFSHATSSSSRRGRLRALVRFAAVSGTGLILNAAIVFAVVNISGLPYMYAVGLMVTLVPAVVFVLSRQWAFT